MKRLKLAVISDIHAGEGARAKDLCPPRGKKSQLKLDDNYKIKFLKFIEKFKLRADYLILPGDLTTTSQPDEVKIASQVIESAADVLGVTHEKILFVPGNHDVDWAVMKIPDSTGMRRQQRYDPLRLKDLHFSHIMERGNGDLLSDPHYSIWEYEDLIVVGYNSSHHDDPSKQHHGLVNIAHLNALQECLGRISINKEQVRLFLVHHHPIQYNDPIPETPDFSVMVNAEQLHKLLRQAQFDILVHGHKHIPRFSTQSLNGSPDLVILCSGSFSVQIDTRWTGTVNNQFHIIDIESRDPEEDLIQGRVLSWTYNYCRGWEPSEKRSSGIPHIEPFGTYTRPIKLQSLLRPILLERFKKADYIEWSWIITQLPTFRHLRPEIITSVLDSMASDLGYRRHGDSPEELILLKDNEL